MKKMQEEKSYAKHVFFVAQSVKIKFLWWKTINFLQRVVSCGAKKTWMVSWNPASLFKGHFSIPNIARKILVLQNILLSKAHCSEIKSKIHCSNNCCSKLDINCKHNSSGRTPNAKRISYILFSITWKSANIFSLTIAFVAYHLFYENASHCAHMTFNNDWNWVAFPLSLSL